MYVYNDIDEMGEKVWQSLYTMQDDIRDALWNFFLLSFLILISFLVFFFFHVLYATKSSTLNCHSLIYMQTRFRVELYRAAASTWPKYAKKNGIFFLIFLFNYVHSFLRHLLDVNYMKAIFFFSFLVQVL